ncbi:hypothetical protein N8T08_000356 [Aspergillus melleus]|uniref:Uncharacterized protein n=1 Tax=Aspergillus melleus TaxID=138277 RepID=A0ACC3BBM9_9EURO|nr:hypothetical protein N8T08_000356 [Aspergillus melleus]
MKGKATSSPVVLYWHRTDLRLHNSPALHAALNLKPLTFIPVWTWDPYYNDLSKSYTKLNPKQKLWVVCETPQTVLPKLWKQWDVTHLVFEKDTDAYARDRDETVMRLAKEAGVEVVIQKAVEGFNKGRPAEVVDTPGKIPDPWDEKKMDLSGLEQDGVDPEPDVNQEYPTRKDEQYVKIMGPKDDFGVPTLHEIGIDPSQVTTPHKGGEAEALKILSDYIKDDEYVGTFEKPKASPAAFQPQSTTLLSPHLHFSSLSVRQFWWDVQSVLEDRSKAEESECNDTDSLTGTAAIL